jgi:glycosyltransferase involved in cell wall biosynthesis
MDDGSLNSKLITIGIPTYNGSKTIKACLDSCITTITCSSFKGVEVLVVDNCSTDGTREIVSDFVESNPGIVRYVRNEENIGLDGNIDKIFTFATGSYVKLLGDDDLLLDDFLSNLHEILDNEHFDLILNQFNAVGEHRYPNDSEPEFLKRYYLSPEIFSDSGEIVGQISAITYSRESYLSVNAIAVTNTSQKFMYIALILMLRGKTAYDKRVSISVRPGSPRFTQNAINSLEMQINTRSMLTILLHSSGTWNIHQQKFLKKLCKSQTRYSLTFIDYVHRYSSLNSLQVIREFYPLGKRHLAFYLKYIPLALVPKNIGNEIVRLIKLQRKLK